MYRTIRLGAFGVECVEGEQPLYRKGITGVMKEVAGKRRGEHTEGFWNCYIYEFWDDAMPYAPRPPEPRLTWRLGFSHKASIESDGFSGSLVREKVLDQVMFTLGAIEWRADLSQRELYFKPPDPKFELRTTMLAFCFFDLSGANA